MLGICPWTDCISESDGLIANLQRQFHCIHPGLDVSCLLQFWRLPHRLRRFRGYGARVGLRWRHLHPYGVGTDNCVSHISKASSDYQKKAWKVNMNPASMSFFMPREVSVLSMAQIWRTDLRMWCSGLYTEDRHIKRSWKGVGITPVAWHFTCQTVLSLRWNNKGIWCNTGLAWHFACNYIVNGWPTCLRLGSTRNFLITCHRSVGNKVTSTECHKMQRFSFWFAFWNIDWKMFFLGILSTQCKIRRDRPT